MAYQQRGRLLVPIKTQVVPIGDLGLPIGGVEGLQFPDDLPPVLAVNTIQTPAGARIIQGDNNGHLIQTLPKSTQLNLVAPRTDTATTNTIDFASPPAYTAILFTFSVTAISGSGATITFSVQGKSTQGSYSGSFGGGSITAITTATTGALSITAGLSTSAILLPPIYRILLTIAGTTPSVTWFCDIAYR